MSNLLPASIERQVAAAVEPFVGVAPEKVLDQYDWPPVVDDLPTAFAQLAVYLLAEHQTDPAVVDRTPSFVFTSFVRGVMIGEPARLEMISLREIDPWEEFVRLQYQKQQQQMGPNPSPADFPGSRLESLDKLIADPAELNSKVPPIVMSRFDGKVRLIDGVNRTNLALMKGQLSVIRGYVFNRDLELSTINPTEQVLLTRVRELLRGSIGW